MTGKSIKISAVIITYNEEKNINRCVESLKDVADEIVILDSFSTDNTRNLCLNCNVRFFQHKFEGHIEQKNKAIEYAQNDYILSLDADEALSDILRENILKIKENADFDAYSFNRLTNYCGKWIKHSSWYPDRKIRLFDKNRARWGGVNPHDKVVIEKDATHTVIKGDLLHYSFYTIDQHIEQINKFSAIKAREMHKKGKKFSLAMMLISTLFKFFKMYFLKLGFLDGYYGFVVCVNSAHSNFLKYAKLRELSK